MVMILMAPGSSLGGARPKANIVDEKGDLWIAKFPSKMIRLTKELGNFSISISFEKWH